MNITSSQFTVGYEKSLNRTDFFVLYKETNEELGTFLCGIDSTLHPRHHEQVLKLIKDTAEEYFLSQNLIDPSRTFEQVLHGFNTQFEHIFNEQHNWTKKIHLTIALLENDYLHFVNFGYNKLLLIKHKYYIDIVKEMSAASSVPGKQLFDQIYSGSTKNFTRIALTNQIIFEYINEDKMRHIFSLLPLTNIELQIENLTQNTPSKFEMAGVILQSVSTHHPSDEMHSGLIPESSLHSINKLNSTSKLTNKLLNPQVLPDFTRIKNFFSLRQKRKKTTLSDYKDKKIPTLSHTTREKLRTKDSATKLINFIKKSQHTLNNLATRVRSLPSDFRFSSKNLLQKIKYLPPSSKGLLILASVLIIILTYNVTSLGLKKQQEIQFEYYEETVQDINNKLDEAQAAIIYGNNETARELIVASLNLIYNLPKNNEEREKTYNDLFDRNRSLYNDVNKFTPIPSPVSIVDATDFMSEKPTAVFIKDTNLLLAGGNTLLNIDIETKAIASNTLSDFGIGNYKFGTLDDTLLIMYDTNDRFSRYDLIQNNLALTEASLAKPDQQPISLKTYNGRIYILDTGLNQIWRLNKSGNDYTSPQPWLQSDYDIARAKDFAIDGNVYILGEGKIDKFIQGRQTDFTLEKIEPNLTNAIILKTGTDIPYLYILDSANQRFIVFNKDGSLAHQYTIPSLTELVNFTYDYKAESSQTFIYLLNGKQIYQIAINE